ncbi:MAG: NGG1p interacting factor NIF3 [Candidatus Thioglobus sp.]|uniref:NGG1p interacting factor NIF3 n=1 Tax=Candidatus Thioglobus sp. TaxID=2026721 RepID=UPI002623498B|nr:NGG1p interacting factor NIF3 [Candidatus Thioglobus sp.]MDC9727189.1 NGG1p interacting factor NIF3 [Candidatus Thioglobus sp.]
MYQISFYVPETDLEIVKNAMFDAGAGRYDNYEQCAWQTIGMGQFKPVDNARPAIGLLDELEAIEEYKVEMVCIDDNLQRALEAMKFAHPYEQVAYTVIKMDNQ